MPMEQPDCLPARRGLAHIGGVNAWALVHNSERRREYREVAAERPENGHKGTRRSYPRVLLCRLYNEKPHATFDASALHNLVGLTLLASASALVHEMAFDEPTRLLPLFDSWRELATGVLPNTPLHTQGGGDSS